MKKVNLMLTYATAFTVLFSSCKDDVEEMAAPTGQSEIPTKFSAFTAEENKTKLEDNGITLIKEMSDLKTSTGLATSTSFVSFLDRAAIAPANGRIMQTTRTLSNLQEGKASLHEVFTAMQATEEEPTSIQAFYNQYIGIYSWNNATEGWDYSQEGSKIVFRFPSTEVGTKNNAEFIIHSYKGVNVQNPVDTSYTGDLPTQLITELLVDGKKESEYKFNAAYNQQGEPTSVTTSLMLNSFIFSVTAVNDSKNVGAEYSLKKGGKLLIAMGAGAKGTFTAESIESSVGLEDGFGGDVAQEVNAYFQLMDIKLAGHIALEKLKHGHDSIYANSNQEGFDYNQAKEKTAALLNESFDLIVFYASSKEKIADTEVYTYTDSYMDYEPEFDADGYYTGYKEVEVSYTATDIRMIFADATKSDLATYFSDGFTDLTTEFSKFIADME